MDDVVAQRNFQRSGSIGGLSADKVIVDEQVEFDTACDIDERVDVVEGPLEEREVRDVAPPNAVDLGLIEDGDW